MNANKMNAGSINDSINDKINDIIYKINNLDFENTFMIFDDIQSILDESDKIDMKYYVNYLLDNNDNIDLEDDIDLDENFLILKNTIEYIENCVFNQLTY